MNSNLLLTLTIIFMWLLVMGACSLAAIFIITIIREMRK